MCVCVCVCVCARVELMRGILKECDFRVLQEKKTGLLLLSGKLLTLHDIIIS